MKQMRIEQADCAMKVSTDACILGAWTPILPNIKTVLDIGTGTGLLSLMLAQRADSVEIDALEIDSQAAAQARQNVSDSPFSKQINIVHTDAKKWEASKKYDLIISNPPFFTKSLKGDNEQRNAARHNDDFTQDDLCKMIFENLSDTGYASVLLPVSEKEKWLKVAAQNGLFQIACLSLQPYETSKANRNIWICSKLSSEKLSENKLIIYRSPGVYTVEFTELLRPFYLNL